MNTKNTNKPWRKIKPVPIIPAYIKYSGNMDLIYNYSWYFPILLALTSHRRMNNLMRLFHNNPTALGAKKISLYGILSVLMTTVQKTLESLQHQKYSRWGFLDCPA